MGVDGRHTTHSLIDSRHLKNGHGAKGNVTGGGGCILCGDP